MATVVRKRPGQTEDKLIADFRKKVMNDEILQEMKEKEFHKKPSILKQERIKQRRVNRYRQRRSY